MLRGLHILVVDDTPDVLFVMTRLLTNYGATVDVASCVDEALDRLEARRPDVLLSDISMPGRSGLELMRTVRAREGGSARALPAAAVTALAASEIRDDALAAGFQEHIRKPVNVRVMVETIRRLVGHS